MAAVVRAAARKARPRIARRAAPPRTDAGEVRLNAPLAVYTQLRDLIVHGRLGPGARIVETEVAARLGVSRTPVRDAIKRLQQEGYIVEAALAQQSRASVAPMTAGDARDLFLVVGQLEGLAAWHAAQLGAPDRRALAQAMRTTNIEFRSCAERRVPDHNRLFDLDERFHRAYVEAAAGPRLLALHGAVKPQAERYERVYVTLLTSSIPTSVQEHDDIIRAIRDGAPAAAQHAVEINWRNAAERLAKVIEAAGERGSW
jgi:DNA-binding GntR family transcriptional regulator